MSALINAQNITVIRENKTILKDVSLSIGQHDFITIIGPNGAGKTMLLKCLMGFYTPDDGQVERQKNLSIGYVPQRLVPDYAMPISVKRFLTLRCQVTHETLQKIVEETAITAILNKPLHILSGGELQRVMLARALTKSPDLLVLDESAQNLDVSGQLAFYKLLERIYAEHKVSILLVSHDLHLVMASTKKVVCLFHHVCCSGEPQAVAKDPEFTSLFGDDMAKMMAVYHHAHDHHHKGEVDDR